MLRALTVALCGDVMLGRGIDQVLAHPGDPTLREDWVHDAREYVTLAEVRNGPVPRPAGAAWPWGDALPALDDAPPDVRVLNLETAITRSDDFARGKAVCYRMSPDNVPALAVARPDVCVLANNHVLDFGRGGLEETLDSLSAAGFASAGAGRDVEQARRPALVGIPGGGRLLVSAFAMVSSGVPRAWAAEPGRPGVHLVSHCSPTLAADVVAQVRHLRQPGDVVVVSVHWGSNWGYDVGDDQVRFAHALVDGGVDVVHGHSSHHPRPIEVYRGQPILYGCGDLINDYEGISGFEEFRPDLRCLYLVALDAGSGTLAGLRIVPFRSRRLRLERADAADARWLAQALNRHGRAFGTVLEPADGALEMSWASRS